MMCSEFDRKRLSAIVAEGLKLVNHDLKPILVLEGNVSLRALNATFQ